MPEPREDDESLPQDDVLIVDEAFKELDQQTIADAQHVFMEHRNKEVNYENGVISFKDIQPMLEPVILPVEEEEISIQGNCAVSHFADQLEVCSV